MALILRVRQVNGPKCKGEKVVKVEFRGVAHLSKVLEDAGGEANEVEQRFEWPVARPVESHETLQMQVLAYNRYFNNRVLGSYGLVLQKVVEDSRVSVTDSLLDPNNKPLAATISFDVGYIIPDGTVRSWAGNDAYDALDGDQQMLIDLEQNIANLERTLSTGRRGSAHSSGEAGTASSSTGKAVKRGSSFSVPDKSPAPQRKRSSTLKSVRSLIRLGKQRPPKERDVEESVSLLDRGASPSGPGPGGSGAPQPLSRANSLTSMSSNEEVSQQSLSPKEVNRSRRVQPSSPSIASVLKAHDFQVCLTVIEARQLAGLNMDPVVCVQIGDQKKYTSVKESTNCPYYNEYFVFDFHIPPVMLFDKIITLSIISFTTNGLY